jgi:1-acyl-sn-glycerol-3-phosphate acyltransferase
MSSQPNNSSVTPKPDPSTAAITTAPRTKKDVPRPEDRFSIRALHVVNTMLARVYHDLKVLKPATIPRHGPAILVSNHISPIDPVLIQSTSTYRLITWMMAKEYMDLPVLGRVFKKLDVIPVERGGRETGPLRTALRRLHEGRIIGIFPEGKISTTNELLDFQTGVALMAIRAKVPVYPAYLDGTQRNKEMVQAFLQRSRSVITFGPAVIFDRSDTSKESIDAATAKIKEATNLLKIEVDAYRKMR